MSEAERDLQLKVLHTFVWYEISVSDAHGEDKSKTGWVDISQVWRSDQTIYKLYAKKKKNIEPIRIILNMDVYN